MRDLELFVKVENSGCDTPQRVLECHWWWMFRKSGWIRVEKKGFVPNMASDRKKLGKAIKRDLPVFQWNQLFPGTSPVSGYPQVTSVRLGLGDIRVWIQVWGNPCGYWVELKAMFRIFESKNGCMITLRNCGFTQGLRFTVSGVLCRSADLVT